MIKNNFKILKKTHAYLQTILKAPVKFQKDRLKTVVGVTGSRYLHPIHFCSIRTQKMSKLRGQGTCSLYTSVVLELKKCLSSKRVKSDKNNFRILKKDMHIFILKAPVKFQKDRPKTVGGVKGTRYLRPIDFCNIRTKKTPKFKMCKKW